MAGELARRYADHPALAMWHVHNEYGCHNAECYCDESAAAFRRWLRGRYADDLDALNDAWGTRFWSQWYYDWDEILPPRPTGAVPNPTQQLDWRRFSSDELLSLYEAERRVLLEAAPEIPATTNTAPMTYMHQGRQYIVLSVAAPGHPAELVALALPQEKKAKKTAAE